MPKPKEPVVCEIINPSDKYTCEVTDLGVAAIGLFMLSGKYAIRGEGVNIPMFDFLGEAATEKWFVDNTGMGMEAYVKSMDKKEVGKFLQTVKIVGKRSSINNIGAVAKELARDILSV